MIDQLSKGVEKKNRVRIKVIVPVFLLLFSLAGNFYLFSQAALSQTAFSQTLSSYETALSASKKAQDELGAERNKALEELTSKIAELEETQKEVEKARSDLEKAQSELKSSQAQISNQKAQIDANAQELSELRKRPPLFSFQNNSTNPNIEQQKEDMKAVVTSAYDYIVSLYSEPYLLHSVTITFVDSLDHPTANGQITINNSAEGLDMEIKMKEFDKNRFADVNTIIHEILHSFHGLSAIREVALEEGMAVAATDEVMKRMAQDGKISSFSSYFITFSDARYEELKNDNSFAISSDTAQFYNSPQVYNYYQYVGYSWRKLAGTKPGFFKEFNEKIYEKKRTGQVLNQEMVRQVIQEVVSQVDGQPISEFIKNKAFNLE